MNERYSGVYFIQRTKDGAIKIGFSCDVGRRISTLQTGCPDALTLAGLMIDGTAADERNLQRRFAALSISGEWFKPGPGLLEYIARHPAPEYFNEDRLRSRIRRFCRSRGARLGDAPYRGVVPSSFAGLNIPCRIPVKSGLLLLEYATARDLRDCRRALKREADAAVNRAVRAYPAVLQTEDPATERFIQFEAWARVVAQVLEAYPDLNAGDALALLREHERASA